MLRWLMVLALALLTTLSFLPAIAATVAHSNIGALQDLAPALVGADGIAANATWVDGALWYAAGLFYFVSLVRLIRHTFGFWAWSFGFACTALRWVLAQGGIAEAAAMVQGLTPQSFASSQVDAATAQIMVIGVHLFVGLIILLIDAADGAERTLHEETRRLAIR